MSEAENLSKFSKIQKKVSEGVISASSGDWSQMEKLVKENELAKKVSSLGVETGIEKSKSLADSNTMKKLGKLNRKKFSVGKAKAEKYHDLKKGVSHGFTPKQSKNINSKMEYLESLENIGKQKKEFDFAGKKRALNFKGVFFYLVILYVLFCLYIDGDKWYYMGPDNASYIIIGFILSGITNDELGFPIKIMRRIMIDLIGDSGKFGFTKMFEKGFIPLFRGLRNGASVTSNFFSFPAAKIILYIPILIISLIQWAIPVLFTIALIPITLVVGLITGVFTVGAGAEVTAAGSEAVETVEGEADMFIGGVLKKFWRTLNKIIPVRDLLTIYIMGYIFYTLLLPMLIDVYLIFFVIIVVHMVLYLILVRFLLHYVVDKFIGSKILRYISFIVIMGIYYYLQFYINTKFVLSHQDPIYTLIHDILKQDGDTWSNTNIKQKVKDLLLNPENKWLSCLYIAIAMGIIKTLSYIAIFKGKFDT